MKRLLVFLCCVFVCGGLLVAGDRWLKAASPPGGPVSALPITYAGYLIQSSSVVDEIKPPELPDISRFSLESVRAALPPVKAEEGAVGVELLEKTYRKAVKHIPFLGERQQRLDPLAIVISRGVYDLPTLMQAVDNPAYIEAGPDGIYIIRLPIIIQAGAALRMDNYVHVRLAGNQAAFIANFGSLAIVDATVEGWDEVAGHPTHFAADKEFRPYIVSWCNAQMTLAGSHFSHLGYFDSKSYGITYTSCSDTLYADDYPDAPGATGLVLQNIFEDIYYGFYSYESSNINILHNRYIDNVIYGIDPHDRSKNLIIANNHISGSKKKHGIIISRDVDDSYIFGNISEDNAGSGLMLDRQCSNNVIRKNIFRRNKGDGMAFYESPNNISYENIVAENGGQGIRIRNSDDIKISHDVIPGNARGGVQLYTASLSDTNRNIAIDPYTQSASASILDTEMAGNRGSDITLNHATRLDLARIRRFNTPDDFLAGDLKGLALPPENFDGNGLVVRAAASPR